MRLRELGQRKKKLVRPAVLVWCVYACTHTLCSQGFISACYMPVVASVSTKEEQGN